MLAFQLYQIDELIGDATAQRRAGFSSVQNTVDGQLSTTTWLPFSSTKHDSQTVLSGALYACLISWQRVKTAFAISNTVFSLSETVC